MNVLLSDSWLNGWYDPWNLNTMSFHPWTRSDISVLKKNIFQWVHSSQPESSADSEPDAFVMAQVFLFWWLHWRQRGESQSFPRRDKCSKTQLEHQDVALNGASKGIYLAAATLHKCSYSKLIGKWASCILGSLGRGGLCWHGCHRHDGKPLRAATSRWAGWKGAGCRGRSGMPPCAKQELKTPLISSQTLPSALCSRGLRDGAISEVWPKHKLQLEPRSAPRTSDLFPKTPSLQPEVQCNACQHLQHARLGKDQTGLLEKG